ncbi:MAG: hypothetical protein ABIC40_00295 [bacterium]
MNSPLETEYPLLPKILQSGPLPIILLIIIILVLIYIWINYRMKKIQRDLHVLGQSFYEKERELHIRYKSGLLTEKEYRLKHQDLLRDMRNNSRKMTDGPP